MKRLYAIGEALIDFTPVETGKGISEVKGFEPHVGGAPANVLGAYKILGGESSMITKLGEDPFGDKIENLFKEYGIGTEHVLRTEEANTSLAFVALKEEGNREFSFYRKPGADMLLSEDEIDGDWFNDAFALHFCSVSLGNYPMREAHVKAIKAAKERNVLISFDPNLRFNLWESEDALKKAVLNFLPCVDILKISDEELEFITGETDVEKAAKILFSDYANLKLFIFTAGKDGQRAFTRNTSAIDKAIKVDAVDTTGAGDAFIGSFLYQLGEKELTPDNISDLRKEELKEMLNFSGRYAGMSVLKAGGIQSYPTKEEVENFSTYDESSFNM
ncbi:MAG: carbohydrate kinase [Lachnospiraceae bacterium]|nr:carbohydrate kinase [Lachnospiraceae bacterium]